MTIVASAVLAAACSKSEPTAPAAGSAPGPTAGSAAAPGPGSAPAAAPTGTAPGSVAGAVQAEKVATKAGVEAGGITREASEGPAASVTSVTGTVELRRVGESAWQPAAADAALYAGDQLRTADAASANIVLADESTLELAEVSRIAITSRLGTADPASGAAVLAGLARFTVAARAPGEGPFRVYTPAGIIVTKGTTYGVGVTASGATRVGVEQGEVDVIGLGALDATPVEVDAGHAVALEATGEVGSPLAWPADDWGTWRDELDAEADIAATFDAHGEALAALDGELADTYATLDTSAGAVASFETGAAASATANDGPGYQAALPEGAAAIDASFAVAGRAEALTWAYAGRAALAEDLYVRHPGPLQARWTVIAPRVDAAVLWPKRYEVTATGYLEPLRAQYYVHHPRGRVHAPLVGVTVPAFYAAIEPPAVEPVRVRARISAPVWIPPPLHYTASARPVWVAAPSADWRARVRFAPAAPRARVAWYVRPPSLRAKLVVGAPPSARFESRLRVAAPAPRASLRAAWRVPVGMKVRVGAPDLAAGARARAGFRVGVGVPAVRVKAGAGANVRAGVRGSVRAPVVRAPAVRAKVRIAVPQVKVKIKAPSIRLRGEAKGRIRLGN